MVIIKRSSLSQVATSNKRFHKLYASSKNTPISSQNVPSDKRHMLDALCSCGYGA